MTTAASRASPQRRPTSGSSSSPSNSIARGATARSAVSQRAYVSLSSSSVRRSSTLKPTAPLSHALNGTTQGPHESLSESLKQETERKEQLLVSLQNKDQIISTLSTENDNLTSALTSAETRVNELYADQSRMEEEMAARIEVTEKLRGQVRELEKEKRDVQRRYNEQTSTFEAERQAFYDNEQHLKSRILSLTQALSKAQESKSNAPDVKDETEPDEDHDVQPESPKPPRVSRHDLNDAATEPPEITSLKLELSTLSTSYGSLQSTLVLLQTQLVDLKRVNNQLQEENESYMILLREKTLSGHFHFMKQGGGSPSSEAENDSDEDDDEESTNNDPQSDAASLRSTGRNTLDRVEETPEDNLEQDLDLGLQTHDRDSPQLSYRSSRHQGKHIRKRVSSTSDSPGAGPRGESLADLPITGPGLDLAAELGRAENKDILDGNAVESTDRSVLSGKGKKGKKHGRKLSAELAQGLEASGSTNDIDALRTEVKSLKDANKALSLYASKIIDRIIAEEGFEHVLAADYDKQPSTPSPATPAAKISFVAPSPKKPRPSSMVFRSSSNPLQEKLTTFNSVNVTPSSTPSSPNPKAQRRSLSFDWKSFSLFAGGEKKEPSNLRPLTLKPGASMTGARKLETLEDEEDRRERDRLHATMKLMGIQPTPSSPLPGASGLTPTGNDISRPDGPPPATRRFSLFQFPRTNSETSSINSAPSIHGNTNIGGVDRPSNLTHEALEQAEAENQLAALDAHERDLSAEIAKGSTGGFTDIPRRGGEGRRSRRSRKSGGGSGSGSTVWSAGIGEEDGDE